ncbi:MAG TPA: hydroxymethylbilane synthase [Desulfitobacteriaceae bacterium]|nr:hydroxymethylbilane synthase [Desulfitobacteriaceae bacterium]
MKTIRIGTRDSQLAMWQAKWVQSQLSRLYPACEFLLVPMKTKGDKILDVALAKIGDKGLFTKELEEGLLREEIDLAVHSLKDLPTVLPAGLEIAAFCLREEPRDVFISKSGLSLNNLPAGAILGTSSLRRKAQLLHYRPDLNFIDLRGNLQTRWQKLLDSDISGIILAAAGVIRIGWEERITELIPVHIMLPAVGQGSIALEIAAERSDISKYLRELNHPETEMAVRAERAMMRELEGGCQVPIGALGRVQGREILLQGAVASLDGQRLLSCTVRGSKPEKTGLEAAARLLAQGAKEILAEIR